MPSPADQDKDRRDKDRRDKDRTQVSPEERAERAPLWRQIGPGLITGAACDDPSAIGTFCTAGAQFGYGLLWLGFFVTPLMVAVQEMCGRLGRATGKGLAGAMAEHYPRWMVWAAALLLSGVCVTLAWADLGAMAASVQILLHGPRVLWLVGLAAGSLALVVFVPYKRLERFLKWLALALLSYVVVAVLPATRNDWAATARGLVVPHWSWDADFLLAATGILGTSISASLFFWQSSEEVERAVAEDKADRPGGRKEPASDREVRSVRADTAGGMIGSQAIGIFVLVCAAATLHAHGQTRVDTAQQAAGALRPLGRAAYALFAAGIVGAGLLAVPTLAGAAGYTVAEAAGWPYGLYRRPARAPGFYAVIAGVLLAGLALNFVRALSPVKGLLYAAALNGVIAPPLLVLLLLLCNRPDVLGDRTNGRWANALGVLATVVMTGASGFFIWAVATGKASH